MNKIILNGRLIELTPELEEQIYSPPTKPTPDLSYQDDRSKEYPPLPEQFDMMYHDWVNGTYNWYETIAAIKAKYPKPEGI